MRARKGFTLVELITVVAISAILFTLILIPVVQGFNLTRAAQGFADAQDRARILIDQITREIASSAGVRDNSGLAGTLAVVVPGADGRPEEVLLDSVKLDIVKPAQGDPGAVRDGAFVNPDTGKADPTLKAPRGDVVLPVAPGSTLVRYFVGLRRPLERGLAGRYNNPYDGLLMRRNSRADNLYVLYRAEVNPFQRNLKGEFVYFDDQDRDLNPDYDDPYFFALRPGIDFDPDDNGLTSAGIAKAERIRSWLARAVVVTEISRFDMIQPVFDKRTRQVTYDGNAPRLVPLVRFQPTRVSSEPAEAQLAARSGDEAPNLRKVGADTFVTEFGGWTSLVARLWPSRYPQGTPTSSSYSDVWPAWDRSANPGYLVGRPGVDANGVPLPFSVFFYPGTGDDAATGTELFDADAYLRTIDADPTRIPSNPLMRYPFSYAVSEANVRSGWLGNRALREQFVAFVPRPREGKVVASFAITEVGNGDPLPQGVDNRPSQQTGPTLTPGNDPALGGVWTDAIYRPNSRTSQINKRFNKLWNDWDRILPPRAVGVLDRRDFVKRFMDLRVVTNADGTASPLHPTLGFPRARIVPGSEIVVGPDQRPGPNYGRYVRYTRVTERPVGRNEYLINYVHQRESENYADLGFNTPADVYDVRRYVQNDVLSALIQPRFRAGYIEFNSEYGEPIPQGFVDDTDNFVRTGVISVFYRFQFTEPNDVVAVDYDSRQVMTIGLTIRNYPQTNLPNPQTITVKGSAAVRNFIR